MPDHANALALLAACQAAQDRRDLAGAAVRKMRQSSPDCTLTYARKAMPFARQADLDRFCEMLGKAGLPT